MEYLEVRRVMLVVGCNCPAIAAVARACMRCSRSLFPSRLVVEVGAVSWLLEEVAVAVTRSLLGELGETHSRLRNSNTMLLVAVEVTVQAVLQSSVLVVVVVVAAGLQRQILACLCL